MKKYLVNYVVGGEVFECFASKADLDEMEKSGILKCYRKLTQGEMMEIEEYGF